MDVEAAMLKKIIAFMLVSILVASVSLAADDPKNIAGYGKTVWGMTPDEVLKAEAQRAEKLEKPVKYTTGIGLIIINGIEIGAAKFNAIFIFDGSGKKLEQVNLKSLEEKNDGINILNFSYIEKLLTEKYGAPTHKDRTNNASWKLQKTSIDISHANLGVATLLVVKYTPVTASENAARDL